MISIFMSEPEGDETQTQEKAMGRQRQRLKCCDYKPKDAKDGQQPPGAGRGKEWILP